MCGSVQAGTANTAVAAVESEAEAGGMVLSIDCRDSASWKGDTGSA